MVEIIVLILITPKNYCIMFVFLQAFQVLSEYLQLLDSFSELSAIQEMSRGVEVDIELLSWHVLHNHSGPFFFTISFTLYINQSRIGWGELFKSWIHFCWECAKNLKKRAMLLWVNFCSSLSLNHYFLLKMYALTCEFFHAYLFSPSILS